MSFPPNVENHKCRRHSSFGRFLRCNRQFGIHELFMTKLSCVIFLALMLITQFACANLQTSENAANFGRDKVFPSPVKQYPGLEIYLNEYVGAQTRKDWEKIFSLTYPKLIELEGGRKGFMDKIIAKRGNAKDFSYLAGKPAQTLTVDGQILAVIPAVSKQRVAEGWKFSREIIIAVSKDDGRKWMFADAADKEKRKILFPAATDKLEIPEISPPWIEK